MLTSSRYDSKNQMHNSSAIIKKSHAFPMIVLNEALGC